MAIMLALNGDPSQHSAVDHRLRPWHAMWFLRKHIFQILNAWSITQYNHRHIIYNHIYIYNYIYIYGWVNYNDLTATSLGIMVNKGNHSNMALIQVSEIF